LSGEGEKGKEQARGGDSPPLPPLFLRKE